MSKWQSLSANRVSSFRHSGATPFSYCPSFPKNRIFATFFGVQENFLALARDLLLKFNVGLPRRVFSG
jgi:hypothetical protein